ncbi:hypothetical protein GCM10027610_024190 [Dactylosporangium cerinum]
MPIVVEPFTIVRCPSLTLTQLPPQSLWQACAAVYGFVAAWAGVATNVIAAVAEMARTASRRAIFRKFPPCIEKM